MHSSLRGRILSCSILALGDSEYGWLDEGLSIVAEELGSLHYEAKCPGTACRTNPSQLFPDSSQGFISNFLYDSYQYALIPDTATVTLHSDAGRRCRRPCTHSSASSFATMHLVECFRNLDSRSGVHRGVMAILP